MSWELIAQPPFKLTSFARGCSEGSGRELAASFELNSAKEAQEQH
jgi:hypothetical protein